MRVTLRVALATISAWGLIWCIARAQSFPAAPPLSDPPESVDQIRAKAEAGDAQAQYQLARDYNSGTNVPKDYKQAFDWCLKSAEQGYVKAEFTVATLYQDGIGVDLGGDPAQVVFDPEMCMATQNGKL
jgi:TPR repeat protein